MMKINFRNVLPTPIVKLLEYGRLLILGMKDAARFARYSSMFSGSGRKAALTSKLTMEYHAIEKGLSFREPRPGFGEGVIQRITKIINEYLQKYERDQVIEIAIRSLEVYCDYMENSGAISTPGYQMAAKCVKDYGPSRSVCVEVGFDNVTKRLVAECLQFDPERFFNSRHSIRDFSDEPVSIDSIKRAVALAQTSPSVCNRQSARVHLITDPDVITKCLEIQKGARGFSKVPALLVCTGDMRRMVQPGERNQCLVDGGMYAMALVYAFHSIGLGTCCLNWSKLHDSDRAIREVVAIPRHEVITMLMAVGNLRDEFRVAASPKLGVDDVLTHHS